jgi:ComF family protein
MELNKKLRTFATKSLFLKDIKCVCCDAELEKDSRYCMCNKCYENLPYITNKVCKKCGEPIKSLAEFCMRCKNHADKGFDVARAPFLYAGYVRRMIIDLKYNGKRYLAEYLSYFLLDAFYLCKFDCNLVVPVPVSKNTLKTRGYNQTELLCSAFVKNGFDVETGLIEKVLETQNQVELNFKERQTNLLGAFKVADKQKVKGKKILLVDDVYTTGATAGEIAGVLKKAGASSVSVLTLCHEMPENATN